ncbi:Uncharacterized membrane protein [Oceanobacillus limi]|uniref:Uncharacterized membrane protein n=1 Tax=Oceanobacillus limi TaxID=930131 RepID=A0A1I0FNU6_9BACI|nr:hypothetical protein [Oceanobacillus limi]SET59178.1 Uncharacterized membrane protein [Oceanobacillus limi]
MTEETTEEKVEVSEDTSAEEVDSEDVKSNKGMAILAYLGFLFIVPLLAAKESKFAMYHTNQGLVLFIIGVAVYIVGSIIPVLGWLLILPLGSLLWLVWAVIGIINAANGKEKPLPLIGNLQIIK